MLIDAYEAVMRSPRLAQVRVRSLGGELELDKVASTPRMVWIPTGDVFGPPDSLGDVPLIIEGKRVRASSIALRKAGCAIYLFTEYGDPGQRQMEHLLNELHNALHEELTCFANYEVGEARWYPRAARSEGVIEVVQPIRVYVPVWSADPAQLLGDVRIRLT